MFSNRTFSPIMWFIGFLSATALACNAPFTGNTPATDPPVSPTAAPLPTTIPNPPSVTARLNLNIRNGPGENYDIVGAFVGGAQAQLLGRDESGDWWLIQCPANVSDPCWVSASSQHTEARNIGNVEVAPAPPTPTPIAGPPPALIYASGGEIHHLQLELSGGVLTAIDDNLVAANQNVGAIKISADGEEALYLNGEQENRNSLKIVNLAGGTPVELTNSSQLPPASNANDPTLFRRQIAQFGEMPDDSGFWFNSQVSLISGLGVEAVGDFWVVSESGDVDERFPEGTGTNPAISPSGTTLFAFPGSVNPDQEGHIVRANVDGSDQQQLIWFGFINTASEYAYAPTASWTDDGSRAFVLIPGAEPFSAGASASLWQIPAQGEAQQVNALPGNFLFSSIAWSGDGSKLAYTQNAGNNISQLIIADGDGLNGIQYGGQGNNLRFLGWSPDHNRFLYATGSQYFIGQLGSPPSARNLPAGHIAQGGEWVNNESFLVASLNPNTGDFAFTGGNLGGAVVPLLTVRDSALVYDLWVWQP